jgi:L-alanine-DL-glutamate epimerase-like enolase superfamily enzyme
MLDVGWCGGIGEAKKIATMAESYEIPVAPHDCTGPVLLTASVHLAMASPNALVQEVVRAFYFGWYRELVDELPPLVNGFIAPTEAPGPRRKAQGGARVAPRCNDRVSTL